MRPKIEQIVDSLIEGDRPSNRPTKETRDLMIRIDELYAKSELLQKAVDAAVSALTPVEAEIKVSEEKLALLVDDYKDRVVRLGKIVAQIETVEAKKSKIPQWSKWRDWVLAKFNSISADMGAEAAKMLESFKQTTPASTKFSFKRNVSEGVVDVLNSLLTWARQIGRRIQSVEKVMAKMESAV